MTRSGQGMNWRVAGLLLGIAGLLYAASVIIIVVRN